MDNASEPDTADKASSYGSLKHGYLGNPYYRGKDYYHELSPLVHKTSPKKLNQWRWSVLIVVVVVLLVAFFPTQEGFLVPPKRESVYEFIVVGGGPSGILVATKLARLFSGKVLLLESGSASQSSGLSTLNHEVENTLRLNKFDIPLLWSGVASNRQQRSIDPLSSQQWPISSMLLSRGLGGGGLINAMIYVRSLPEDFKRWNLSSWTWEKILPHYTSLETYDDSHCKAPLEYMNQNVSAGRGRYGPITTIPACPLDLIGPLFVKSLLASGWPLAARGFNIPEKRVGGGFYDFNIRSGVRHSVAEALLGGWNANSDPPLNLVIVTGATVKRILFRGTRAIGVEYRKGGRIDRALLRNLECEVVLACGAIMTPQLLANSGIHDGGEVSDLPGVGKNLHDHPVVGLAFELVSSETEKTNSIYRVASEMEDYFVLVETLKTMASSRKAPTNTHNFAYTNMGAFATPGFSAGAFLTSPWANDSVPDIQLTVFPRVEEPHIIRKELEISISPETSMLVTVALLDPEARYEVLPHRDGVLIDPDRVVMEPDSDNPFADWFSLPSVALPEGKPTYLTPHDVRRIAWGVSEVRRIMSYPPLSTRTGREVYPGAAVLSSALDNHIYANHLPNSHWVGSAKMGNDEMAVVDENLRVYGTEGLRIVDASILPYIPNGNTHSAICVVASRAADLISSTRLRK